MTRKQIIKRLMPEAIKAKTSEMPSRDIGSTILWSVLPKNVYGLRVFAETRSGTHGPEKIKPAICWPAIIWESIGGKLTLILSIRVRLSLWTC